MPHTPKANSVVPSLSANGEMAELIGAFDWSSTPVGAPENWPLALRTMAPILLANRFPQLLWWGSEYICIYNDAYIPILGNKHPWGLGRPVRECWSEVWDVLRPLIDTPFHGGPATWIEDFELTIHRLGFTEETHFTVAYSAVPDDTAPGGIGGVLATVHEISEKVVGQRRVAILRDLSADATGAKTVDEACTTAAATLKPHIKDIPFAILYVIDASGTHARLAASCGIDEREDMRPALIPLDNAGGRSAAWPLAAAQNTGQMQLVEDLPSRFVDIPQGPWSDAPRRAAIVPIRSHIANQLSGFLVAGLSAWLQFDDGYRNFLNLAATQIAAAISSAQSYQEERKRAEALAEIDRAKTAFFSNVSHEFRTPLTLMLGPLEDALANSHGVLPTGAAASLAVAHRNALRLLKLVNTMLDFSRIEAGRAQACYQPIDLAALTEELASNFQSLCDKAGLQLTVHCTPGEPVYVDRDMWEKIVLNLLSNAFKFTLKGGIEVRLKGTEGQAVLTVRDTGVGIPDSELPHMFERFHRIEHSGIEHSHGRTHEGTGIGLALVQELVKLHGGAVGVESKEGEGSTFRVAIPRGKAHLDPERIRNSTPAGSTAVMPAAFIEEAMRWLPDEMLPDGTLPNDAFGETRRTGLQGDATRQKQGKSLILWADDNADMRAYVSRLLGEHFDVEAVPDGNAALIAARTHKPDLILTDVMMPGLDGFGLLREVRADPQLSDVPVILLSARAGEEARIEGLQAGADDYLTKPFSARQMLGLVESHIKLSHFRRETIKALKRAERNASLLASIVEFSDDAIISKDLDGTIMSWNQGAERLFGYTAEEVIGQSINLVIPPDRLNEELEILAQLRRGESVEHFETIRMRRDGVLLNLSLTISPIRDTQGRIVGASKTARDITERVRQQQALKEANAALRQANSDLQQFAYSASHDLQEPLRMVRAYSELLQRRFGGQLGQDGDQFIRHTVEGATRMDNLLRDLRTYIRISAADRKAGEETDAGEVLNKVLANLQPAIDASGASIHAAPLPRVSMPEFELEQVFHSLISNAIRYRTSEPPNIRIAATPRDGAWLFSVQDNGIGIEPQFRDQIFGIFKRLHTNAAYPGTGMGLAICLRIFERAGGRIWVESGPGKGSTFYFTIPAASAENVQAA
ncbi:MAG TPA: ATP-binding protein [Bryobacteraceae bacterium]